jgi:hypothetical protein
LAADDLVEPLTAPAKGLELFLLELALFFRCAG